MSGPLAARDAKGGRAEDGVGLVVADTIRSHPRPGSNSSGAIVLADALLTRQGGPDVKEAQAGHLVVAPTLQAAKHGNRLDADSVGGLVLAPTLKAAAGSGGNYGPEMPMTLAATLTSGSHPGSNAPGRHKEDDVNLVHAFSITPHTGQGTDIRAVEVDTAPGLGAVTAGEQTDRGVRIVEAASVRRLTPTECERLMSWPDGWTAPAGVRAPDSRRYHACGDGVVSNVAEWIGRRIMAIEGEKGHVERR